MKYFKNERPVNYLEILPSYGQTVTDQNSYRPNIENVNSRVESGSRMTPVFAFDDGKDTGERLQFLNTNFMDITEVEQIQNALEKRVAKQTKKAKEEFRQLNEQLSEHRLQLKEKANSEAVKTSAE